MELFLVVLAVMLSSANLGITLSMLLRPKRSHHRKDKPMAVRVAGASGAGR